MRVLLMRGELGIEKAIKEIERKQKDFSATANENSLLIYFRSCV